MVHSVHLIEVKIITSNARFDYGKGTRDRLTYIRDRLIQVNSRVIKGHSDSCCFCSFLREIMLI